LKGVEFAWIAHMRRNIKLVYPNNMAELPPFEKWLFIAIAEAMAIGEKVLEDVVSISVLPSSLATTYHSMYAFGNRLQVASA
jgi:hypothetical protein